MATKTKETVIEVPEIVPATATLTIVGDSDLVLNKMNAYTVRTLTFERKDKAKELAPANPWECIATSVHWLNGLPNIRPEDYDEDTMKDLLTNNRPCISGFGFKKQLNKAVVRNKVDKYSTAFDANVNIVAEHDQLIPICFTEHFIDEKLMSPKRGAPVLTRLNRFAGWSADVTIAFMENVFKIGSIVSIVNLAGFGIGIGSGTTSGYGRFHVADVK